MIKCDIPTTHDLRCLGVWKVCGITMRNCSSKFHGIWSREIVEHSIFMIVGLLEKALHHRIPPKQSSDLQIGPRISLAASASSQELSARSIFQTIKRH